MILLKQCLIEWLAKVMIIQTKLSDLPTSIGGYVVKGIDDTYTIVLNSKLSHEDNVKSYLHELSHIKKHDFEKTDVQEIESEAHRNDIDF